MSRVIPSIKPKTANTPTAENIDFITTMVLLKIDELGQWSAVG
jgi:hypothetical protein